MVALAGMVGRGYGAPGNGLCGRRLKKARNLLCLQQYNVLASTFLAQKMGSPAVCV